MKKIVLIALGALMFTADVNAQKQAGGEKNLEVQFAPLGGQPISIGGIRFRKFNATGTSAWRVNVFIGMNSKKDITQQSDTSGNPELTKTTSGMSISINPGYEKHFAGTERLSPYIGGEIAFNMTTSKVEEEDDNADKTINTTTTKGEDGSITLGLNLVAGCDFYFSKSIYLGTELGFGFSTTSKSDKEVEYSGFTSPAPANPAAVKQGSSFQLGPNVNGMIRLGFLF